MAETIVVEKRCRKCGVVKPVGDFYKRYAQCAQCCRVVDRERESLKRESINAAARNRRYARRGGRWCRSCRCLKSLQSFSHIASRICDDCLKRRLDVPRLLRGPVKKRQAKRPVSWQAFFATSTLSLAEDRLCPQCWELKPRADFTSKFFGMCKRCELRRMSEINRRPHRVEEQKRRSKLPPAILSRWRTNQRPERQTACRRSAKDSEFKKTGLDLLCCILLLQENQ